MAQASPYGTAPDVADKASEHPVRFRHADDVTYREPVELFRRAELCAELLEFSGR